MATTVIHWNKINMRGKEKNLPKEGQACLIFVPGKVIETARFCTPCGKPRFLRGNEFIKPVSGMLWVPADTIKLLEGF